jgi:hypothetical protein
MQAIRSVMTFGKNKILKHLIDTAVAVFGVYFKLHAHFMPFRPQKRQDPHHRLQHGARQSKRISRPSAWPSPWRSPSCFSGTLLFLLACPLTLSVLFDATPAMM